MKTEIFEKCRNDVEFALCFLTKQYNNLLFDGEDYYASDREAAAGEAVVYRRDKGFNNRCYAHIQQAAGKVKLWRIERLAELMGVDLEEACEEYFF
jgi:hypothetical protein